MCFKNTTLMIIKFCVFDKYQALLRSFTELSQWNGDDGTRWWQWSLVFAPLFDVSDYIIQREVVFNQMYFSTLI